MPPKNNNNYRSIKRLFSPIFVKFAICDFLELFSSSASKTRGICESLNENTDPSKHTLKLSGASGATFFTRPANQAGRESTTFNGEEVPVSVP